MRRESIAPVRAVVDSARWSEQERAVVLASLRGQVTVVLSPGDVSAAGPGALLVVTTPVVFACGAVGRLRGRAARRGRVVTRLLVPGAELTGVALWSGDWVARHGAGLAELAAGGLAFDRDRLPHGDPQARAWVRADEVGVVRFTGSRSDALRWARIEGMRLALRHGIKAARGRLGPARRATALAWQRRAQPRRRGLRAETGGAHGPQVR